MASFGLAAVFIPVSICGKPNVFFLRVHIDFSCELFTKITKLFFSKTLAENFQLPSRSPRYGHRFATGEPVAVGGQFLHRHRGTRSAEYSSGAQANQKKIESGKLGSSNLGREMP